MGGGVGCPGPHSSETLPLFGRRGGGKNKNNSQAFVRGENRLLPLHGGAPGADLRKGPSVPYCQASNPTPTLGTLSWSHIPGATPSVTYPHVLCVPYQACGPHRPVVPPEHPGHGPPAVSHVTHTLDHATRIMSHLPYEGLCTGGSRLATVQLHDFLTLGWCKSDTHSVETALGVFIFPGPAIFPSRPHDPQGNNR